MTAQSKTYSAREWSIRPFIVAAMLAAGIVPYSTEAKSLKPATSIKIKIDGSRAPIKRGSNISIHVTLKNVSGHEILIAKSGGATGWAISGNTVTVYDDQGNLAPETRVLRVLKGEEPPAQTILEYKDGRPSKFLQEFQLGTIRVDKLEAKGTMEEEIIVTTFYNLDKPGKYTICTQRTDSESKTVVRSNRVKVTVVP